MELGKLGMVTVGDTATYDRFRNPLLQQGVLGINPGGFAANPMSPDWYAKPTVAAAIAKVVGGEVVPDPMAAHFNTGGVVMLAIRVGETTVNAGALCGAMGNDAAFPHARAKSWEICSLLGIDFDGELADKIYAAIFGGK